MGQTHRRDGITPRSQLLTMLRDHGPLSRVELSHRSGLSPATVTRHIARLLESETVTETSSVSERALGRPAHAIALNAGANHVVGVQIGVGAVSLGVVDVLGKVHRGHAYSYDVDEPASDVIARVGREISALIGDDRAPLAIGVAVPGPVDPHGRRVLMPINLPWRDVPIADQLHDATGLRTVAEHNVRSMALAEARFGVGRKAPSLAFIYAGTGIGAGVVAGGQTLNVGVHGAIELGHLVVEPAGRPCVCGGAGCLETVASAPALRRTLDDLGLPEGDAHPLIALCVAPGAAARTDAERVITHIGTALSTITNLLNPAMMMLGGALAELPEWAHEALVEHTRSATFPLIREAFAIRPSTLGMDAGVLGSAAAAFDSYLYA